MDISDLIKENPKLFSIIYDSRSEIKRKTLGKEWEIISSRHSHIKDIKEYRKNHNDEYPPDDCINIIVRCFTNRPHPDVYDYEMRYDVSKAISTEVQQYLEMKLRRAHPQELKKELKKCSRSFVNTPDSVTYAKDNKNINVKEDKDII